MTARRLLQIGGNSRAAGSTPVYETVRGEIYRRTAERPPEIPDAAVVVPGVRPMKGAFAEQHGLQFAKPMT